MNCLEIFNRCVKTGHFNLNPTEKKEIREWLLNPTNCCTVICGNLKHQYKVPYTGHYSHKDIPMLRKMYEILVGRYAT